MFELEKAIRAWKKELSKNPALEETYIFELESVLRDEVADLVRSGISEKEAFQQTSSDMGKTQEIGKEFSKVRVSGWRGFLIWNYLRISLRKIRRQKGYSFINIAGLAVGLASCILMMLWIKDDLSFDRFHANKDSLFRVIMETKTVNTESLDARTPTPLGQALKDEFPEVLDFSRYQGYIGGWMIKAGDKSFFDDTLGVGDPSFFTMFSFPLLKVIQPPPLSNRVRLWSRKVWPAGVSGIKIPWERSSKSPVCWMSIS
jgi:putative ABC transport system permease protein